MIPIFSYQAQLADLGVGMAFTYANMAMSGAYACAAFAWVAPLAIAASARPFTLTPSKDAKPEIAGADPYSAYRSDGGHATTLVIMGS